MYAASKPPQKLGVSQGKVKNLMAAASIEADEVKRGCKYYNQLLEKS